LCQRGALRLIAVITQGAVIRKILRHLKRVADPPPITPVRTRQTTCDWAASIHGVAGVARDHSSDVRTGEVYLPPLRRCASACIWSPFPRSLPQSTPDGPPQLPS
jgi:hypothetical protein